MLNKNIIPRPKRKPAPRAEITITVRDEYITLGQLLKVADIIQSGGEAKPYLAETPVLVNGEPEQRRGRKLRPGDLIVTPHAAPIRLIATPDATDADLDTTAETAETGVSMRKKPKAAFAGDVQTITQENTR